MKKFLKFIFNLFLCLVIGAFVVASISTWRTADDYERNSALVEGEQTPAETAVITESPVSEPEVVLQPDVIAEEEPLPEENILKLVASNGETVEIMPDIDKLSVDSEIMADALINSIDSVPGNMELFANGDVSAETVNELRNAFGEERVSFSKKVSGVEITDNTEELDIYDFSEPTAENIKSAIELQPGITFVNLADEEGNSCIELEQLGQLQAEYPDTVFSYPITLFDQTFTTADESLEYVEVEIGDAGLAQFREIMPYMTKLNYFKLDKCNVSSEAMAQMREDYPDIKVVWRIYFSYDGYNCLTDTKKIWATGTVTDGYIHDLMYCTDVKYLDMGHNCITNINFINYMPDLEVAVLSISWIADITPLANCKKLEFLEIYSSEFWDVSPLAGCTSLKHLNLGNDTKITDISSLYDLDLERFYFNNSNVPGYQFDRYRELHPDCECSFGVGHPVHGTWRFVPEYRGEWDAPEAADYYNDDYLHLREVIGYDYWDYSR